MSIVQSGQELHGTERFVADGLITEGECQNLISLLEVRNMIGRDQCHEQCTKVYCMMSVSCNSVDHPYFTF